MMDMADVLLDPDFRVDFPIIRSVESVDARGRTQSSASEIPAQGVIHPATEEELKILPEAQRVEEIIAVYTATRLTAGDDTHGADRVGWQGGTYKVLKVMDYSQFGFVMALAQNESMMGKEVE